MTYEQPKRVFAAAAVMLIVSGGFVVPSLAQTEPHTARVIVKALHEVVLSTNLDARIAAMPFTEGQRFRQGELLVQFDCKRYKAEAEAAWAFFAARNQDYQTNQELNEYDAIGTGELAASKAEARGAQAKARALDARIHHCEVRAPFSGVVVERFLKEFESARSGSDLLKVMNDERLELELIVSSSWLRWLQLGDELKVVLDETSGTYVAELVRVAAVVDAASQTVKLTARLRGRPTEILPGMSGTAHFERSEVRS